MISGSHQQSAEGRTKQTPAGSHRYPAAVGLHLDTSPFPLACLSTTSFPTLPRQPSHSTPTLPARSCSQCQASDRQEPALHPLSDQRRRGPRSPGASHFSYAAEGAPLTMPFVGGGGDGDDDKVHSGRKRRREGGDGRVYRLYSPERQLDLSVRGGQAPDVPTRKPDPLFKRHCINDDDDALEAGERASILHRRRPSVQKALQGHAGPSSRPCPRSGGSLLLPCHICHRRPTKKSELDSFAECQGCRRRTCFVCIRKCHGWHADQLLFGHEMLSPAFGMDHVQDSPPHDPPHHQLPCADRDGCGRRYGRVGLVDGDRDWDACGHRAVVCSRCCIEKGGEGEVVCLGCLSSMCGA